MTNVVAFPASLDSIKRLVSVLPKSGQRKIMSALCDSLLSEKALMLAHPGLEAHIRTVRALSSIVGAVEAKE